ncbi:MAG: hypothetical protein WCH32_13615 [Pseudomonadota bacterium]
MKPVARRGVGWRIYGLLVGMSAIMYFQQRGVMIAAERIMPELWCSCRRPDTRYP